MGDANETGVEFSATLIGSGTDRYFKDIELMLNKKPAPIFKILWRFVIPGFLIAILIATLVQYEPPTYGAYHYPAYAGAIGWVIALVTAIPLPVWFVKEILAREGPLQQRIKEAFQPNSKWGPACNYKPTKLQLELLT